MPFSPTMTNWADKLISSATEPEIDIEGESIKTLVGVGCVDTPGTRPSSARSGWDDDGPTGVQAEHDLGRACAVRGS